MIIMNKNNPPFPADREVHEIYSRIYWWKKEPEFALLILVFLILYLFFLWQVQFYTPERDNSAVLLQIRQQYYARILTESLRMRKSLPVSSGPQNEKNESSLWVLRSSDKPEKPRGLIGMETVIIQPFERLVDSLFGKWTSPISETEINLDDLLGKIRHYRQAGPFQPDLDYTPLDEEKIKLEKTYSPAISGARIENPIFHQQAARDPLEVQLILQQNESTIRYCFRKHNIVSEGKYFIRLRFALDPGGRVIAETVVVLETNISDPELIRCIVRSVSRWKNFGTADDSTRTYVINQKWIY